MLSNRYFNVKENYTINTNSLHLRSVNDIIDNKITTHLYQVGHTVGTYLPNLLTKYFNASGMKYKYTYLNPDKEQVDDIDSSVEIIENATMDDCVFNIPTYHLEKDFWFIYWCDELHKLRDFTKLVKKIYKPRRKYNNDINFQSLHLYVMIPILSDKGASVNVYRFNDRLPTQAFCTSITNKWKYSYQYDMLATMYMYNITQERLFNTYYRCIENTNKVVDIYQHIGGDGVSTFKINQHLHNIVLYDSVNRRGAVN